MQGIERNYCDVSIKAVLATYRNLLSSSAFDALNATEYGKNDTLGLDAIPEITIRETITNFDRNAILITEEEELDREAKKRWPTDADPIKQPLILISDPTDRSSQLKHFLHEISRDRDDVKVGKLMGRDKTAKIWEEMFEPPATITGATSAITCIRKGKIVFSVILNYITHSIYVATSLGVYYYKLPHFDDRDLLKINLDVILSQGKLLNFVPSSVACPTYDDMKWFVTFLGKSGYKESFQDTMIFANKHDEYLHHTNPGGPSRILYLSELQKGYGPIGFIVANGEKIGEWIHWLAFVKFISLRSDVKFKVFEVYTSRPYMKDGILMSTSPSYSVFRRESDINFLDISRLRYHDRPSKFRSMIVVCPADNDFIIHTMLQHRYREITLHF